MSCKYRVRKFYSKGAYLVLAWTLLVSAAANAILNTIRAVRTDYPEWIVIIPLSIFLPITLFLGFLANSKLQDYIIARIGIITLFFFNSCFLCIHPNPRPWAKISWKVQARQ